MEKVDQVEQCGEEGDMEKVDQQVEPGPITQSDKQNTSDACHSRTSEDGDKIVAENAEKAECDKAITDDLGDVCVSQEREDKQDKKAVTGYEAQSRTSHQLVENTNDKTEHFPTKTAVVQQEDEFQCLVVEDNVGKKVFEMQLKFHETQLNGDPDETPEKPNIENKIVDGVTSSFIVRNISGTESLKDVILSSDASPLTKHGRKSRDKNTAKPKSAQVQHTYQNKGSVTYKLRNRARKNHAYIPTSLRCLKTQATSTIKERKGKHSQRKKSLPSSRTKSSNVNVPHQLDRGVQSQKQVTLAQNVSICSAVSNSGEVSSDHLSVEAAETPYRSKSNRKTKQHPSHMPVTKSGADVDNTPKQNSRTSNGTSAPKTLRRHSNNQNISSRVNGQDTNYPKSVGNMGTMYGNNGTNHKLDLSGISYFELVKLRDACNYYIKQYESLFQQQQRQNTQSDSPSVPEDFGSNFENVQEGGELMSDTEDSGYSEQGHSDPLAQSSVSETFTPQTKTLGPIKRSERLKNVEQKKTEDQLKQRAVPDENEGKDTTKKRRSGRKRKSAWGENRNAKTRSTCDSTGANNSLNFCENMEAFVKLEPLDDESLLNQVLGDVVSRDSSGSNSVPADSTPVWTDRRRRIHCKSKTKAYRAMIQRAYRARQKALNNENYMAKERERRRKSYIPVSQLDHETLLLRRENNRQRNLKHRLKRKLQQLFNGNPDSVA